MASMRRAATLALMLAAIAVFVVGSDASVDASEGKREFVRSTVSSHDVVIFSKSYCPYCRRAKGVFQELKKVPYIVELDQREDGYEIQDALSQIVGRRTVPQVFINGKHIGGSDDTLEAFESGKLAELLGISSEADL
ncbi:uncharacterized protein A4U43_C05F35080 [Asparagus officinalis]|uniref:Glutaredoxin domain-containing protein n=1 Tax=Asparagus officinalis TaxID=4686 RepID=A0A5P1F1K4_ASPOF|nr:glutaredoxin-C8 isoform X1 [Asparagus officinalis]ONK70571.1 uncharacterized protein A4U43_C05F35080 [Asparagus officinalis]